LKGVAFTQHDTAVMDHNKINNDNNPFISIANFFGNIANDNFSDATAAAA
jgi:hypothetical protein